jgi:hypothetical protein
VKHIVAILAHKNGVHLEIFVQECIKRDYAVLIHLDQKCRAEILQNHHVLEQYVVDQSISVTRAHFSIVQATHALLQASKNVTYDYFHLISGEDFMIKSAQDFDSFFTQNAGLNFINHISIPVAADYTTTRNDIFSQYWIFRDRIPLTNYKHAFFKNGISLVDTTHFRPNSLADKIVKWSTPTYRLRQIYLKLFKRKIPKKDYYAGSAWFSVTRAMAHYFMEQTSTHPSFYNFFSKALFPDEIYFQTLAKNSPMRDTIINSDLRYINWDTPVNDGPSILSTKHLDEILQSNGFFARKMDLATDKELHNTLISKGICQLKNKKNT